MNHLPSDTILMLERPFYGSVSWEVWLDNPKVHGGSYRISDKKPAVSRT